MLDVLMDEVSRNSPPGTPTGFGISRAAVFAETPDMVVPSKWCTPRTCQLIRPENDSR